MNLRKMEAHMNIITIMLIGKRKPLCKVCGDRGELEKPWKRNGNWVFVKYPCPACNPKGQPKCH